MSSTPLRPSAALAASGLVAGGVLPAEGRFCRGRIWRVWAAAAVGCALALSGWAAPSPLRLALIASADAGSEETKQSLAACQRSFEQGFQANVTVISASQGGKKRPILSSLPACDAALFYGGGSDLDAQDAVILREFLAAGKGLVVVRNAGGNWPAWPEFERDILGAKAQGRFAGGYPMHVINLYPHAVFTGVSRLETRQPMPLYTSLAEDAQIIMEGTVGEATAPLAWLRQSGTARVCQMAPGEAGLFQDEPYLRLLGNALQWSARRPIPGARAIVQRTYLDAAYPGAFAVILPEGPAFCLDPVRGGISQVWAGDFVDLRPRWLTKQGAPGQFSGQAFYHDPSRGSFWSGVGGEELAYHFKGYRVNGASPEFYYEVAGREIVEQIQPSASGMGIVRRFRVGPGSVPLGYRIPPDAAAEILTAGVTRDDRGLAFSAQAGGEFTIEMRQKVISP